MDQHPVPQNISSYEFRLVGDMTLKQFFQLAGGGGVGLIWYNLPLPFLVKWPLILISIGMGAMLAFVPVQGRSFSAWLLAFVRAVYSPTEFKWEQKVVKSVEDKTIPVESHKISVPKLNIFSIIEPILKKIKTLFPKPVIINNVPDTLPNITPLPPLNLRGGVPQDEGDIKENSRDEILTPIIESQPLPEVMAATHTDLVPSPESANILSGLVYDVDGKIVEGAIVEIINSETGMPVRALRSNKLGQFTIATPLTSGKYAILTEKDGLLFDPVSIVINNTIIKSILLKSK